jgi:hypothetical protein
MSNEMPQRENDSVAKEKAAGSTSGGAFSCLPILPGGFGEAQSEAVPFGSLDWLIFLESQKKPK